MKIYTKLYIAAILLSSSAVKAETVTAVYDFVWKGFVIATSDAVIDLSKEEYAIDIRFRTRGVMKLFSNGRSVVTSQGTIGSGEGVLPREFSSSGRWDGDDYSKTVYFDDQGVFRSMDMDWPEDWLEDYKREEVPIKLRQGPDPLSVMLPILMQPLPITDRKNPALHRLFDGRGVFDLQLACEDGTENLEKVKRSNHHGEANLCRLGYKMVAGFPIETEKQRKKREKREAKEKKRAERLARRGKKQQDDTEKGIRVWFQSDPRYAGMNIPVRGSVGTDWGTVKMYLRTLSPEGGNNTNSR